MQPDEQQAIDYLHAQFMAKKHIFKPDDFRKQIGVDDERATMLEQWLEGRGCIETDREYSTSVVSGTAARLRNRRILPAVVEVYAQLHAPKDRVEALLQSARRHWFVSGLVALCLIGTVVVNLANAVFEMGVNFGWWNKP